jgi:hypothetical protein
MTGFLGLQEFCWVCAAVASTRLSLASGSWICQTGTVCRPSPLRDWGLAGLYPCRL